MNHTKRALAVAAFLSLAFFVRPAHAATITVNASSDDLTNNGNCTLREAIKAANTDLAVDACTAGSGTDTIILSGTEYPLGINGAGENADATGDLDITSAISIIGTDRNSTYIDVDQGSFTDRIFDVQLGASLSLTDLTVGFADTTVTGAGINDGGSVTLTRVDIYGNTTTANGAGVTVAGSSTLTGTYVNIWGNWAGYSGSNDGGGIYNSGTVTLSKSFLGGNFATRNGGGMYNTSLATLTNTAIVDNDAFNGNGGGIRNTGGSTTNLDSDTIDSNVSASAGAGITNNVTGTVNAQRTILSNNTDNSSQSDCNGTFNSQDYNLIEVTTGCTLQGTTTHNITGVDPNLAAGWYSTSAGVLYDPVTFGSPAIDASGASCQSVDVADTSRPQRGTHGPSALCDIGNFEYIIDETAPTVSASVDVSGTTLNTRPTLTINSDEVGTITYGCTSGSWSSAITSIDAGVPATVQLNTLDDNTYSCRVQVTDVAGNVGQSDVISFIVNTAPAITVVTPVARYTNNPKVTIHVSLNATLTYVGCTGNVSSATPASNVTITLTGFTEGAGKFCSIIATGGSNGHSNGTSVGDFTYDITPPTIAVIGDPSIVVPFGTLSDNGAMAYDALSGVNSTGVVTTRLPYSGSTPNDGTRYSYSYIRYTATDNAGNTKTVSREVDAKPKVENVSVTKGSFTITKPDGHKVVETPFGKNYAVPVTVRKVTFVTNIWVVYFAVPVGPTRNWQLKMYDVQGQPIKPENGAGGVSKTTLPASFTQSGVNLTYAFDPTTNLFFVAFGSKSGADVPQVFSIRPYTGSKKLPHYLVLWSNTVTKTGAARGNVQVKFMSSDGWSTMLVTAVGNHLRAWKPGFGPNQSDFKQDTNSPQFYGNSGGNIVQVSPVIKSYFITPISPGIVQVRWTLDKAANAKIVYGLDTASKLTLSAQDTTYSTSHTFTIHAATNSGYSIKLTACVKNKPASSGCTTSSLKYFLTL